MTTTTAMTEDAKPVLIDCHNYVRYFLQKFNKSVNDYEHKLVKILTRQRSGQPANIRKRMRKELYQALDWWPKRQPLHRSMREILRLLYPEQPRAIEPPQPVLNVVAGEGGNPAWAISSEHTVPVLVIEEDGPFLSSQELLC